MKAKKSSPKKVAVKKTVAKRTVVKKVQSSSNVSPVTLFLFLCLLLATMITIKKLGGSF